MVKKRHFVCWTLNGLESFNMIPLEKKSRPPFSGISNKRHRQHVVLMHASAITFTLQITTTLGCVVSGKLP